MNIPYLSLLVLCLEPSSSNSSNDTNVCDHYINMLSLEALITWNAIYILTGIFVILFNVLVLLSFFKNKSLRTRTNYFIASLAWADFLVGAISIPGWIAIVLTTYNKDSPNKLMIQIWTSFDMLAGIGSIFHLMALSWDRFCAIIWPLRHRLYTKKKYAYILCMVWAFSILISGLSIKGNEENQKVYNISVIAFCFFLPLFVIMVAQGTIFVKIHQTRRAREQRGINNIKREIRAAKTISIMIFLFIIGWLPFFTISLISYAKEIEYSAHVIFAVKFLQYSNSFFNPILYAQKFPDFRRAYVAMLCACLKSHKGRYKHAFHPSYTCRSGTYRSVLVQSPQVKRRFTKVELDGSTSVVLSSSPSKARKKVDCVRLQAKYTVQEPGADHVALKLQEESSSGDGCTNNEHGQ